MKSSWIWVNPKSNDKSLEEKRGTDTETQKRRPCEDRGRDQRDGSIGQGTLRIASNHRKLGGRHGVYQPAEPPEGTSSANTLIWNVWPPEL